MRTITIQADKANDEIMTDWLAHLVLAIPAGGRGSSSTATCTPGPSSITATRASGR